MKNVFRFWFDAIDRNGKSIQHLPATIEAEDLGHAMQKVSALLPDVTCAINTYGSQLVTRARVCEK